MPSGSTSPRAVAARIAAAVIALVACAWFTLAVVQTRNLNRATSILQNSSHLQRDDPHVLALLHTAGVLNPDSMVELLRGLVAENRGNAGKARAIFRDVTRREPQNVTAWSAAARVGDIAALKHIAELEPPLGNP